MNARRSFLRETAIFLAAVVAALAIGALVVTDRVTRAGLEELFRQRFARAQVVLEEYASSRQIARARELETVLTSPRFLAAIETEDPSTIAQEIPTHATILGSTFMVVEGRAGNLLYATQGLDADFLRRVRERLIEADAGVDVAALPDAAGIMEVALAPIDANNGTPLGRIACGAPLAESYARDLERLTGFEVLLASDALDVPAGSATSVRIDGRALLAYGVDDARSGLRVTFLGSVDDAIRPIVGKVRTLLLGMAFAGSATALALLFGFTKRRVGAQVDRLVAIADRIAREDLDFRIEPHSDDEFGWLERKLDEMRARLLESRRDLDRAHEDRVNAEKMAALGRVAAGIIHDFKSPMAVIRGTAEMIETHTAQNEKLAKQCRTICVQVDRMTSLTRDVLEYASGKSFLEPETVTIDSYLDELRAFHTESFARAGVKLEIEAPSDCRVLLDPARMRRVLDNIVVNAREVSRVGDRVRVRASIAAGRGVELDVRDEGPGIPAEVLPRIFDPFVTSGKEGGTGLGLAIARKIVEDHGGAIEAANSGDGGARFTIVLPEKLRVGTHEESVEESVA